MSVLALVSIVVADFAIAQAAALWRRPRVAGSRVIIEARRLMDAPSDKVWEVVSDLGGYADYVSALQATRVVSGAGAGARRVCTDRRGRSWEETCSLWQPGRAFAVDVDTEVTMRFEAEPRFGALGRRFVEKMADRARRDIERILDAYDDAVIRA